MFDRHILDKPWRYIFTLEIKYMYKYLYDIQVNNKENVPLNFYKLPLGEPLIKRIQPYL